MKIKAIKVSDFKRFHDLTITNIPESAKLVVLAGPNGYGKSSLFDAFLAWHRARCSMGRNRESSYYLKGKGDRHLFGKDATKLRGRGRSQMEFGNG